MPPMKHGDPIFINYLEDCVEKKIDKKKTRITFRWEEIHAWLKNVN